MRFTWDPGKNRKNQRLHRVNFETATKVFDDPGVLLREDCVVDGEQRWHAVGHAGGYMLLLVVHTIAAGDEQVVRLISARKVTPNERAEYEEDGGPY